MAAQVALRRQQDQEEYMRAVQLQQTSDESAAEVARPPEQQQPISSTLATTMISMTNTWADANQEVHMPPTPPASGECSIYFCLNFFKSGKRLRFSVQNSQKPYTKQD